MTAHFRPGDCLLYKPSGLFGRLIGWKTWHAISHVEVYVGRGKSVASRDGIGVGQYDVRMAQLVKILRPKQDHPDEHFNLEQALRWFRKLPPTPYGWLDLLAFFGLPMDGKGIVCSPFAADFYRAGGLDPFNGEPSIKIAPFQFELSPVFKDIPFEVEEASHAQVAG